MDCLKLKFIFSLWNLIENGNYYCCTIVLVMKVYLFDMLTRLHGALLQGNMMDNPVTTKDSHVLESNGIVAGATGMQGWRMEMEVRGESSLSQCSYLSSLIFFFEFAVLLPCVYFSSLVASYFSGQTHNV